LDGAITGFRTFGVVCANADTAYYAVWGVDGSGTPTGQWETGLGTWGTGGVLTRTTVHASSNAGAAVDFSAGTKRVALTATAAAFPDVLLAVNGGTGQSSYAVGDLIYANTTTTLAKLADVATGNVLISGGVGVIPAWGKVALTTHVSGTLPLAHGGTGVTTAQAAMNALAGGVTTARVLRGNGTNVVLAQVGLTTDVTGTLPVGNGGTGATTLTGILKGNGASAFTAVTAPSGAIVGDTDTQSLSNKTLTSAKVSGGLYATNGTLALNLTGATGAVNYIDITNSADSNSLLITATGPSANIDLNINAKGTGSVVIPGLVSLTETQTLSNKTLSNPTITDFTETYYSYGTATTFTLDPVNGSIHRCTTGGTTTITLPAPSAGKTYMVLVGYGGTHTVTFAISGGGSIKWAGGSAPTATSVSGKVDAYAFFSDGSSIYGRDAGRDF